VSYRTVAVPYYPSPDSETVRYPYTVYGSRITGYIRLRCASLCDGGVTTLQVGFPTDHEGQVVDADAPLVLVELGCGVLSFIEDATNLPAAKL
jgi:hypothetical protein